MFQNSDSILMNTMLLESDRIHPNTSGVSYISWQLIHAINCGNCYDNNYRLTSVDMNPVLTVENPPVALNSFSMQLNISRNNNQLYTGANNYIDVGFNDYDVTLSSTTYFNIEIDNCLGLYADQNWYPCVLETMDGVSHAAIYTVKELSNGKYQIRIRPLYNVSSGESQSHFHIYLGQMTNQ